MKDENILDIEIQKLYLEGNSYRIVSKMLGIDYQKVRKVIKKCGIERSNTDYPNKTSKSNFDYLKGKGVSKQQLCDVYNEIGSFRKTADILNLGKGRTLDILRELGTIKAPGHALKYNKEGKNNPFYGKTHSKEVKKGLSERAKTRTEKRNPNYKHGKYLRRPRDFKIAVMTKLRNFVFNRDNHTCCYCETRGGHLHAHHIIPYWVKPEAFEDITNLVTVCTDCHFTKAHLGNWHKFDTGLLTEELETKYSIDRERLSGLNVFSNKKDVSDSLNSDYIENQRSQDEVLDGEIIKS